MLAGCTGRADTDLIEGESLTDTSPSATPPRPVEPQSGFQIYDSEGEAKAEGLRITMEFPEDWSSESGTRPHVLRNLSSPEGNGHGYAQIMVTPMPDGYVPTQEEIEATFDPSAAQDLIPSGTTLAASERVNVDGLPGLKVVYAIRRENVGIEASGVCEVYYTYWDGKLPQFMFCVGEVKSQSPEALVEMFKERTPLFAQMANSIVIHTRYAR